MNAKKQQYSREDKIAYYARRIAFLEMAIERNRNQLSFAKRRLGELQSPDYQNWNSTLARELVEKLTEEELTKLSNADDEL